MACLTCLLKLTMTINSQISLDKSSQCAVWLTTVRTMLSPAVLTLASEVVSVHLHPFTHVSALEQHCKVLV